MPEPWWAAIGSFSPVLLFRFLLPLPVRLLPPVLGPSLSVHSYSAGLLVMALVLNAWCW